MRIAKVQVDGLSGPLHGILAAKTGHCAALKNEEVDVETVG